MSETLLDKARQNLNVAKCILSGNLSDEVYLNYCGYHLQQAAELAIKYCFFYNGKEPKKTHDIDQLIYDAKEKQVPLCLTYRLVDISERLSLWESRTRYILGFRIELNKIKDALEVVEEYIDTLELLFPETDLLLSKNKSTCEPEKSIERTVIKENARKNNLYAEEFEQDFEDVPEL